MSGGVWQADRLRAAIEAVVRAMLPEAVWSAQWEAVVVAWHDDTQTADVATSAASPLPDALRGVPVLVDPPGTRVTLAPGASVLVCFREADPGRPYLRPASAFGVAGAVPIELELDASEEVRVGPTADAVVLGHGSTTPADPTGHVVRYGEVVNVPGVGAVTFTPGGSCSRVRA